MKKSPLVAVLASLLLAPLPAATWAQGINTDERPGSAKSTRNIGAGNSVTQRTPDPIVVEQDYEPAPAIWLLEDEDTKIYMFGTIHVLPEGFRWRNETFDNVVSEVDELVVETSDADGEGAMAAFTAKMIADTLTRTPTSQRLSPEAGEKWLKIAELTDLPVDYFDGLPPLFAMFGAGISMLEGQGSQHEYGVESVLEAEFAAAGKPIGSIEDSLEVMTALLAIDEQLLLDLLEKDLAEWDGSSIETLMVDDAVLNDEGALADPFQGEHNWAQGKTEGLEDLGFEDSPFEIELERVLLEDRNRDWSVWLEQRMDEPGSILLAVGAAHLAGDVSVQSMLSERGFEVKRIQ
ncbi:TraB/GumN family protein [Qipengyuania sp. 1NDW9]|uniref:TraB/GumN family protein n=1 Tax=Qipengyuania xiapuensis TaxID=2867236 RepID=A0ABX8ZUW0_9SPHN|nr:TraB/GumN family protein [Qipengyuania xiapuensis]MBX7493041.1 TraB/GumN family protein [Qipengyuania xiapuensis]QZD92807.1 TraB/GumN family protein [Qipengyuania xiapuensis]